MCDPYNSNPFENDKARDTRSESDANAYLAEGRKLADDLFTAIDDIFKPMKKDSLGFWENAK